MNEPTGIPKEILEKLLTGMMALSRNLSLYPSRHPVVSQQAEILEKDFARILQNQSKLSLAIVDEVLVFEGVPFYQPNIAVREFQRRIEERGVNAVEFHQGLNAEELKGWSEFLIEDAQLVREKSASKYLQGKNILHIKVRDVREVYNRALETISEVLSEVRLGKIPRAEKAKKVVKDLSEQVFRDKTALLALTLLKSYDNYLFNHSVNVSVLSLALAETLKVPKQDLEDIGLAGLLHDIGKTMIPKSIILKPYKLTPEEWQMVKEHPIKSAEIVSKMEGVSELCARLVYEHHINYNRQGYPQLEEGRQVHPYSKIITIADCYDAITTLRPYQKPFPPREAMRIMESLAGKVIDPVYFQEFVRMLGIYPVGSLVRLDSGEVAVVVETYAHSPLTPKIKIIIDQMGKRLPEPIEIDLSQPEPGMPERNLVAPADPLLYDLDPSEVLYFCTNPFHSTSEKIKRCKARK